MRNKIIPILLLIIYVSALNAQNVGINTTSPQASLDVRGSQRAGGISHYVKNDSMGRIDWYGSNLYVPVSQFLMKHSAAGDGLYYNNNAPVSGQLEYRNAAGDPVFFTNFINGNGYFKSNLGIGTITPSTMLHIFKGTSGSTGNPRYSPLVIESNDHTYINLLSSAGNETAVLFGSGSATNGAILYNNSNTQNGFQFRANGNLTRMVIDNTGNVGVGTLNPAGKLHVLSGNSGVASQASNFLLESDGNNYMSFLAPDANSNAIWFSKPSNPIGGGIFYNDANAPDGFLFRANNAPRMVITNMGRVGIGLNSPSSKLHVFGEEGAADGNSAAIQLSNGATGSGLNNWFLRAGATGTNTPAGGFSIGDNNAYHLVMDNAGKVGIGTTTPVFKLDVRNGSINTDSDYRIGTKNALSMPGTDNLFIGKNAGRINTGTSNTFSGSMAGNYNTAGFHNSFFGTAAGFDNTSGYNNSFFGKFAGEFNTIGAYNSFFGVAAGPLIGEFSTGALNNATAIGYNAKVNASDKIRLGNSSVTVIEGQVPYTFPSDGRFKTNVTETVKGLEFIMKLRPVIYNFQAEKMDAFISGKTGADVLFASHNYAEGEAIRQSGFIAQEVEQAAKETGYDFNGVVIPKNEKGTYSLAYSQFVVPLVKAVQEQQVMIERQNTIIEQQSSKIEKLLKEIILIKEKLK